MTKHTPKITVIFSNLAGNTLRIVAGSFNKAYATALEVGFEIYDYEVEEGEEYCAV